MEEGERVGPYRLLKELGRGGQAVVFLAEDPRLGRRVALKVLTRSFDGEGRQLRRFRREAEVAARLDHPGICTVYEAGEDGPVPYIAMRLVEGETLAHRIAAADGRGPAAEAVAATAELFERAARILHIAHEAGLVHRDIKPGNLMVTASGEPVLMDFGLAREETGGSSLTVTGTVMGTPAYVPPEMIDGRRGTVDRRSDVYSLGVSLYEALTGRIPFDAPTRLELHHRILDTEPEDPRALNRAVPADLAVVVATAMAKEPDRRYATALDFAEDLRRVRVREPVRARPVGPAGRLARWARRNTALAASLAALLLALAGGLGASLSLLRRATDALGLARSEGEARDRALLAAREAQRETAAALAAREGALRRAVALDQVGASALAEAADPMRALLLARLAVRLHPSPETLHRLRDAVHASAERARLAGHDGPARSAAFAPAGDRILTAGDDGTARLWDLEGRERAVLRAGPRGPVAAAFAPAGDRIAAAGADGVLRVFDGEGRPLAEAPAHAGPVAILAFSPSGDRLLTGGADGAIRLWNPDGTPLPGPAPPGGPVLDAGFSPDGIRIAACGGFPGPRAWDRHGSPVAALCGAETGIVAVRFAPDGSLLSLSASGRLSRVDPEGRSTEISPAQGETPRVRPLSVAGSRIALGIDGAAVRLFDAGGRLAGGLRGHARDVVAIALAAGGDRVLTAAADGTARLWDADGRTLLALPADRGGLRGAALSPSGEWAVTVPAAGAPGLFDLERREMAAFRAASDPVVAVGFSPDGERVHVVTADGVGRVFDRRGTPLGTFGGGGGLLAASPAGDRLVAKGPGPRATLLGPGADDRVVLGEGPEEVRAARFAPDGSALLTQEGDGRVRTWDLRGRALAAVADPEAGIHSTAVAPGGVRIATANALHGLRIWGAAGVEEARVPDSAYSLRYMEFGPRGERLVTGGRDEPTFRVWDLAARPPAGAWLPDPLRGVPVFSPDGDHLLAPGRGEFSRLVDRAGIEVAALRVPAGGPTASRFSPDGTTVATGSADGVVRLWDLLGREEGALRGHAGGVSALAFSPDGRVLAAGTPGGGIRLWAGSREALAALADARVLRPFTDEERERYAELLPEEERVELVAQRAVEEALRHVAVGADAAARIERDPSLDPAVREAALRRARLLRDNASLLNDLAWIGAVSEGNSPEGYARALRQAERANELAPGVASYVNTLGVALYRCGRYAESLETLRRSDALYSGSARGPQIGDLAFIAMACRRLGKEDEAREALDRVRRRVLDPGQEDGQNLQHLDELERFLRIRIERGGGK